MVNIDREWAIPNLDLARHKFSLTEAERAASEASAEKRARLEAQRQQERQAMDRFEHLARSAARGDITKDVGSRHSFDRTYASDWVRIVDSDPRLAVELRLVQHSSEPSATKPIGPATRPRVVEIETSIVDKESDAMLDPETIFSCDDYKIEQTVDDIRGRMRIVPGMPEWDEFTGLIGTLEERFGVTPFEG